MGRSLQKTFGEGSLSPMGVAEVSACRTRPTEIIKGQQYEYNRMLQKFQWQKHISWFLQ